MDIGTALILLALSPLIGFGIGTARRGSEYARRRWKLLAGYYVLLLAAYGFVLGAILCGATETSWPVSAVQSLGFFALLAGAGFGLFLAVDPR
jgi:hypothetical protein